jgi:lysophospholipase L1-like esterase
MRFTSRQFTFWVCACLAIASWQSGAEAAETNHNFDKWEKEISAYERSDQTNPPPRGGVLFIGSSTIGRWKTLAEDFPKYKVINRGFGGSEIVDSTHFAERVIFPYKPRMVLLRAGGNDLWAGKTSEQVFQDFKDFVAKVQANLPDAEVVFISLSPSNARWKQADKEKKLNTLVEGYVQNKPRVKYLEVYPIPLGPDGKPRPELFVEDQLHFNAEGYKLLAREVRKILPASGHASN